VRAIYTRLSDAAQRSSEEGEAAKGGVVGDGKGWEESEQTH
jgi:hypothetical protein